MTTATTAAPTAGSTAERDPGSFRDPGGFVYRRDGVLYRQIGPASIADWEAFLASGLADRLIGSGRLVGHEAVDLSLAATADARGVIRPEPIDFISYPYEWTFSELQDAALLTLDVELEALAAGWTLKDASAYNVQFRHGRPIIIDSLSFEPLEDGAPWVAYRQFCEHFLAPLALMARRDIRLSRLLRADPDGVPLDLAATLLPARTRLSFGLLSHLHLHARAQRRYAGNEDEGRAARRARIDRSRLVALISSLRGTVRGLRWTPAGTEWSDYADNTSYTDRATTSKERLVADFVARAPGTRAWDLGANTGRYSRIAADAGREVLAFDIDPAAAERNYRQIRGEGRTDVFPLVLDVANPSPGIGWLGTERRSLLDRANPDVVLALALVHHLAISRNVPFALLTDLFARLAPWIVVEFVPKEDPMVRRLLASRRDVFDDYSLDAFRAAVGERFEVEAEEPIEESGRVLLLLRRR
ncbi:MAG TPA: class I SAM-dependent methyltransferase [Candidatus Limnocylindrales bacterium]|nr:class I SAM-dependent methyltransferase [Candidatus Limnocylindrales bacterium]